MNGDEEAQLEAYGRDVIPAFALGVGGRRDRATAAAGVTRHHRSSRPPSTACPAGWSGAVPGPYWLLDSDMAVGHHAWRTLRGSSCRIGPIRPHRRFVLAIAGGAIVAFAALAPSSPTVREARAAAGVNLDQWATLDNAWQNGNLNGNNTRYPEGGIVPFRLAIEGLKAGAHTIRIQYDFTAGGHKAYDFLAR